jgi:hypothetical protein
VSNLALLDRVKAAGEDHEWYPTSRRMLEVVAADLRVEFDDYGRAPHFSILDIGAGDGNALKTLCELTRNEGEKYAIEKSATLVQTLPPDVFVVGTDFHQQTLIDKKVDVVFCNPPYSEFDTWVQKIVSEANCRVVYLVVPQRWKDNGAVMDVVTRRIGDPEEAKKYKEWSRVWGELKVLSSDTFKDSEFRRARAQVDIVKIRFRNDGRRDGRLNIDPFDIWFESTFKIQADKTDETRFDRRTTTQAQELHALVEGQNIVERLEELYHADFERLLGIYRDLEKLDRELFKELGVNLPQVKEGLKAKIQGLKNLYWKELFANLSTITDRLTSKSRKALLEKLTAHTSIDFTADNAYAVVIWAIKNANQYFDQQLLEVYLELTNQENIRNYKSNTRVVSDDWRYARKEQGHTHYTLDYRLVLNHWRCFCTDGFSKYEYPNGLHHLIHDLLGDLCTIAENLGFEIETNSQHLQWEPGRLYEFRMVDGRLFMDVRAFKKGTVHVRLDQTFMRRLNVEAGRLNGWVKSPHEAAREMGFDASDMNSEFGSNFKLKSIPLMISSTREVVE